MKRIFFLPLLFISLCLTLIANPHSAIAKKSQPGGNSAPATGDGSTDGSADAGSGASGDDAQNSGDNGGGVDGGDDGSDSTGSNDGNDNSSDAPAPSNNPPSSDSSSDAPKWDDSAMSSGKVAPPPPQEAVECFGIMGAGQNDNVFVDVDGRQYGYGEAPACHPLASIQLPKDSLCSCENITVGRTEKGELIRGSLKPNPDRRSPIVCYPYDFIKQKITYMNPDYAVPLRGSN